MNPVKLKVINKTDLLINWNNGSEDVLKLKDLRKFCPCATCLAEREKRSKMFIPIFSDNQVTTKAIKRVGNYAIQIEWNDGHNTGIYEYKFLRNFTEKVKV